jgi:sensor histidine kinase YesM
MHWLWRNILINTLLATGIFVFIFYSETGRLNDVSEYWAGYLFAVGLINVFGFLMFYLNKKFNRTLPWNKNLPLRFTLEILLGLLFMTILSLLFLYFYVEKSLISDEETSFWLNSWDAAFKFGIISLVVIIAYSLINFSIFSYKQYAVYQIESMVAERDQLRLQFDALKSQLSPHFLFNSLNTISSLIYKNHQLAEKFIRQLTHLFRYILKSENKKLVGMGDELEVAQAYFEMQKFKYGNCIALKVKVKTELYHSLIPPLSLQMLIENALKHNLICEEKTLHISIFDENGKFIVVKNNFIPKPELLRIGNNLVDRPENGDSHKIGLSNIRRRYKYIAGKEIEVIPGDFFTVKLPIIPDYHEK